MSSFIVPIANFGEYTYIENTRNFPDIFAIGKPVIMTEKVHGCLFYKTKILVADGSRKKIIDIQKGEYVLGVDENGNVVPSLVLNTFNNGKAENWLTVSGKRKKASMGGTSTWNVHCTPNHRFWNPEKKRYIAAGNLVAGDKVLLVRNEIGLTPVQKQILIGKMFGDRRLHTMENVYRPQLIEQTVDWVQKYAGKESSFKWDLETETHNFFANYILVHNSNSRVGIR